MPRTVSPALTPLPVPLNGLPVPQGVFTVPAGGAGIDCRDWWGLEIWALALGGKVQLNLEWFEDPTPAVPVIGESIRTYTIDNTLAMPLHHQVAHAGAYLNVRLIAGAPGITCQLFLRHTNRAPLEVGQLFGDSLGGGANNGLLINVQSLSVAAGSITNGVIPPYVGRAHLWGFVNGASAATFIGIQGTDFQGGVRDIDQLTGPGNVRTDLNLPALVNTLHLINQDTVAHLFYATLVPERG